ncbi:MAG TPA: DEAD/DEAH box helicase [Terriglobales bacterium]|nr:DEAD/DEAH box helicase [Terriglobales bacterium]
MAVPRKHAPLTKSEMEIPAVHNWRTTDTDEINKRRLRAQTESLRVSEMGGYHPIFANFQVRSGSGMNYLVEIRSLRDDLYFCTCVDFRINGLGTCKHIEATLHYLRARHGRRFNQARKTESPLIDIVPDPTGETLRIEPAANHLPAQFRRLFKSDGRLRSQEPEQVLEKLRNAGIPHLRISHQIDPWLKLKKRLDERKTLLREYEQKVQSGEWPAQETLAPLYPYQREGMLHLAFKERALLADEMGLGKTIQAIAACALLRRLGKASRVLVVTPASLKTEWEEQIQRFTTLPYRLVFGGRKARLRLYASPAFFTVTNYEQVVRDALDINRILKPDVVILDEAQRIKNWTTKTAQAVKRLESRYAFVLTGTPIENRIDELYSLMDFLNPGVLGPLFRFNREFYELDERGRPVGYRNLEQLHARVRPFMLRRRKTDVETELPDRTDQTFLVALSSEQKNRYLDHYAQMARLANIAKRRPLTPQESEKLLRELSMMRMVCDTNYILDPNERACPKLAELEKILEECRENSDVKVLIFSEWARMIELVQGLCKRLSLGTALHTGSVPQARRRAEIQRFKNDPSCRVFLSTDSGSTGLNLQNASVVINCDLPWNPARLEQRISRAWRKHQTRPVTVIHLVSEGTIEHNMLGTLKVKQALAEGVLDLRGDLDKLTFKGGRQALLARLEQLLGPSVSTLQAPQPKPLPVDRSQAFAQASQEKLNGALIRCEENYPLEGAHSVLLVVVERDAGLWRERLAPLHQELFGDGKWDPLAPVKIEVIDRATDEALRRLAEAGLIAPSTRAIRNLCPLIEDGNGAVALSEEERQRSMAHRQQASRKLKMATLLESGGLSEEACDALREATLWTGKALAVENRLPEPAEIGQILRPPVSLLWKEALPVLREFASNPSQPPARAAEALQKLLE